MTKTARLTLLDYLIAERPEYAHLTIPPATADQDDLIRALMNVRPPAPLPPAIADAEAHYLQDRRATKGVVQLTDLQPLAPHLYLWQGDITRLAVDAIVNAANSALLGCFIPLHGCIDNAIHSAAGVELRQACHELMTAQGHPEATGQAKVTPAYHLPSQAVIHTVGPIIHGPLTAADRQALAQSYRNCLEAARAAGYHSIALPCISTGEFHFPPEEAAQIAISTVQDFLAQYPNSLEVIFNVFKDQDLALYRHYLSDVADLA